MMQHFEKLYIANIEEVSKKVENSFLFCSANLQYYLYKIAENINF